MAYPDAALATQLRNTEARTGKTLAKLRALLDASGLVKHSEKRSHLMQALGLGYGYANIVVHLAAARPAAAAGDPPAAIHTGPKAVLRPLHDQFIEATGQFGAFETEPEKTYVSLRRGKQLAMIGQATKRQIEMA